MDHTYTKSDSQKILINTSWKVAENPSCSVPMLEETSSGAVRFSLDPFPLSLTKLLSVVSKQDLVLALGMSKK